jgi:hypothetical protein
MEDAETPRKTSFSSAPGGVGSTLWRVCGRKSNEPPMNASSAAFQVALQASKHTILAFLGVSAARR